VAACRFAPKPPYTMFGVVSAFVFSVFAPIAAFATSRPLRETFS